jgi:hypothetical protein
MDKYRELEFLIRRIARKIARTIVRFPAKWYCNHQFKTAFKEDYDSFWIIDIDNTIADTWRTMTPQYLAQYRSEADRIMSIEPFESMQKLFQDIPPRTRLVFLSARYYIRYFVTKAWLKKHGFWQTDSVLVLVEQMTDKTPLLEGILKNYFEKKTPPQYFDDNAPITNDSKIDNMIKANSLKNKHPIIYFDDLSYNHEKGEILYYEKVIDVVRQMPIRYIDYDELLIMQSNKSIS